MTFGANDGVLNGTSLVTLVPAPTGTTKRVVRDLAIHNSDTVTHTITLRYTNGADHRKRKTLSLAAGADYNFGEKGEVIVLDGTTKSVTAVMAAAHTTTAPDFSSGWIDQ